MRYIVRYLIMVNACLMLPAIAAGDSIWGGSDPMESNATRKIGFNFTQDHWCKKEINDFRISSEGQGCSIETVHNPTVIGGTDVDECEDISRGVTIRMKKNSITKCRVRADFKWCTAIFGSHCISSGRFLDEIKVKQHLRYNSGIIPTIAATDGKKNKALSHRHQSQW